MATNQFVARNGIISLSDEQITGSLGVTGAATFSSTVQSIGQIVYSPTLGYVNTSYQSYAGATTWYVGAGISGVTIQDFAIGVNSNNTSPYFRISSSTGAATFSSTLAVQGTTASTSYTTGALVVSGGVGIAGAVYTNGIIQTNNSNGNNVINLYNTSNSKTVQIENNSFGGVNFWTDGAYGYTWFSSATSRMTLSSGGNLSVVGALSGTSASFGGDVQGQYLTLHNGSLNNWYSNATDEVGINYSGYNNGTTQFRNLTVYNGKNTQLFQIIGSTGAATFSSSVQINGTGQLLQIGSANAGDKYINVDMSGASALHGYKIGGGWGMYATTDLGYTSLFIGQSGTSINLNGALSGTSASFSSTTASTSYTTGALVVSGGVGVAGAINTATDITINKGWVYAGVGANTNGNRYGINLYSYDAGAQYSGTMQMDYVTNPILHISTTGNYIQIDNATQFLNNVWSNNGQIRIESSSSGYVALYNGSTTRLGYMGNSTTNFAFTAENSANFTFTGASNFCLTSSGNMGLGTTNPDFASTGNMCLTLQGQSTRARINLQNSSTSTSGVAGTVSAWNGTTYLGSLDFGADGATNSSYLNGYVANAGSVINWINVNHTGAATFSSSVTATAFYNSSDITLKDIISEDGDVIRYKWKDGRDDLIHIGYSAQEKQLLYPDQTISGENNKLTLNYTEILVDKVRQLEKKVESLKNLIK